MACFCLPSLDTSSSYTQGTFLSAPAAPQISPNQLTQPVWRAQGFITFTTSPRANAIRAYKWCASASTAVTRSGASQTPTDRLASPVVHPHCARSRSRAGSCAGSCCGCCPPGLPHCPPHLCHNPRLCHSSDTTHLGHTPHL